MVVDCAWPVSHWADLVQAEYHEMPGLTLTKPQMRRLWGLDAATCEAVVDELVARHILERTHHEQYVLAAANCCR